MSIQADVEPVQIELDPQMVWLQANRSFGNMVEGLSDDWLQNRQQAVDILSEHTSASQVVRMKPLNMSGFVDLDRTEVEPIHLTDGFVTTNPNLILHANPADCGEVALHGFGMEVGQEVLGLFHASRSIVGEGGHIRGIEYMAAAYGLDPASMTARLAPSARAESYAFQKLNDDVAADALWRDYIYQDEEGLWHIDFHQRTIDDLIEFGIPATNINVSPVDTITEPNYFSHFREARTGEPIGGNGLLVALR
jgi:copper oxidase (laccase) domain-containing protein